jgi:hypothetical protein
LTVAGATENRIQKVLPYPGLMENTNPMTPGKQAGIYGAFTGEHNKPRVRLERAQSLQQG